MSNLSVKVSATSTETNYNNSHDILWTIDSGCTDHIITSDKFFCQYAVLKSTVTVKVRNNKFEQATKVGNILCIFNGIKEMILNVYFCEKTCINLISVSTSVLQR